MVSLHSYPQFTWPPIEMETSPPPRRLHIDEAISLIGLLWIKSFPSGSEESTQCVSFIIDFIGVFIERGGENHTSTRTAEMSHFGTFSVLKSREPSEFPSSMTSMESSMRMEEVRIIPVKNGFLMVAFRKILETCMNYKSISMKG
ncbi:hypothetical protein SAY86_005533 [Trapa natans]|uniref:Uncharacterized protein n=1 Tax=Trapa natans TaxID=22666 RepID=A0AAN7L840_TRANT|nr:hypothetical protein SAY86_005533 [Trapa natans]